MKRGTARAIANGPRWVVLLAIVVAATGCATPERPDPLEKVNRGIFAFNEGLDRYALEPIATAWDFVIPGFAQEGIQNFYHNLEMPIIVANDILQAKPMAVVEDVARFFFNTTLGLAGFVDVASRVGIPDNDEDFGQTLGYWGVPPGPYLVVPSKAATVRRRRRRRRQGSATKRKPQGACCILASSASTTSATTAVWPTSRWSSSKATRCRPTCRGA